MTGQRRSKDRGGRMSGRIRSWGLVGIGVIAGVSISYGVTAYAFRESRSPIPVEEIRQFTDVFGAIKANYVEPVEDKKLMQEAISGMLSGLDPHSAFLDGESYRDLQIGTQGEFGGLGIEVGSEDGAIKVVSPIDDTPAARAGIRAGDLIIKIDDKVTRGMNLGDAIKLMRGKPQTPIDLTLARKGEAQPVEVHLIRDIIRVQSVKAHMIEPGYGYVRITQFQDRTTEDLVKRVADLYKDAPLKGLVLDLRNDPGGVLNGAVGVSAVFLAPDATVVTTEGRTEDAHRKFVAAPSDYLRGSSDDPLTRLPAGIKTVPLVVLVNGASASASEIVAGALQDQKRAELIGTQTFGKGSVQSVITISADRDNPAAIKLTTARYFTPSGRSIQAKGIVPDLLVEDTPEGNFSGFSVREADLANHLSNPTDPAAAAPKPEAPKAPAPKDGEEEHAPASMHRYEFGSADDFQLHQAMNFLKGQPVEIAKVHDKVASADADKAAPAKH
jgi:carboxyl-terminal processing protease